MKTLVDRIRDQIETTKKNHGSVGSLASLEKLILAIEIYEKALIHYSIPESERATGKPWYEAWNAHVATKSLKEVQALLKIEDQND